MVILAVCSYCEVLMCLLLPRCSVEGVVLVEAIVIKVRALDTAVCWAAGALVLVASPHGLRAGNFRSRSSSGRSYFLACGVHVGLAWSPSGAT